MANKKITELIDGVIGALNEISDKHEKIAAINALRAAIHEQSPFKNEPVDFVKWVKNEKVVANDYNPNKVAPPEMQLLEVSIISDGYTQPIVTCPTSATHDGASGEASDTDEVVDGFHRNRVGKESVIVRERVMGYLPIVSIRKEKQGKNERIASTIRHNRARGKHQVSAMSEIVIELKNRNWNNARIARELGMDEDEILRLCQISGIESMFQDKDFSRAWITDGEIVDEYEYMTDDTSEEDMSIVKIPNEGDEDRIFHTFDKWEAVQYGFFETTHKTLTPVQCEYKYKELLGNPDEFRVVLENVINEWKYSCEHNLTNKALNRIAWLGQAAMAYRYQIPAIYSSGWKLLSDEERANADSVALGVLNEWLKKNNLSEVTLEEATSFDRQIELY